MSINWSNFSPTELVILRLLQDGHPHRPDELKRVAGDDLMTAGALSVHVSNLRKKLRLIGQDVSTEKAMEYCQYRLVRLTASSARG